MMERRIEKRLIQWQQSKNRKPLLLQGARQVGKTYVLQNFGENRFNTSHYFDLEELKTDLSPIFYRFFIKAQAIVKSTEFLSLESHLILTKTSLFLMKSNRSPGR